MPRALPAPATPSEGPEPSGSPRRARPSAVLFDLDGTLVDGRDAIWDAFSHALRESSRPAVAREAVERLIGHPLDHMFTELSGADHAEAERLVAAYRARFALRAPELVRLTPGAAESLDALEGIPKGIVTTKLREPAELVLDALHIRHHFGVVIGREDTPAMKPDPAPVFEAARRLGVDARDCVMVGDTALDVRAALGAGARVVGVLCGHGSEGELRAAGANVVIPDLRFLESVLGTP